MHEGDRVTCEELIDHAIKLKQTWIDEYANRITGMQSLPVVAPTDYDMPDGALRWSKGNALTSGQLLDQTGGVLYRVADVDPSLGMITDADLTHGNSGSPVFNETGMVVGIESHFAEEDWDHGKIFGAYNFVISSQRLIEFIRDVQ